MIMKHKFSKFRELSNRGAKRWASEFVGFDTGTAGFLLPPGNEAAGSFVAGGFWTWIVSKDARDEILICSNAWNLVSRRLYKKLRKTRLITMTGA